MNRVELSNLSTSAPSALLRVSRAALASISVLISVSGCNEQPPVSSDDAVLAGETYEEFDDRRDSLDESNGAFAGGGCTEDCSGHEAGYAWAEEKGVTDPDRCGGKSWSFVEGCRAYAEQASGEEAW